MVKTRSGYKKVKSLFGKYEDIPEEWEIQLVSKTQDIMMGQSPPSESYNQEKQGLPFYQGVTDFGYMYPNPSVWCTDPKKITAKDTILFSVRAPVGEVNITETQCCLGRGIAALNPTINDLMYCYYIINQNKKRFLIYAQGTTYDAINQKDISSVKLPHTKNILEQQKIASILSGVDALIESTQNVIEKAERLKKGLMQKLLTRGIGHTKFKKAKILFDKYKEIPEEWEVTEFRKISVIKRGASPRPINDPKYFGQGRGWIRIQDISKSNKYLTQTKDYLSEVGEMKSVAVDEGDIIMSIAATVGKTIIVKMKACIHDGFIVFSNLSNKMNNEFLYYLLTNTKNEFKNTGQHGTQSNINSELVSKTKFLKPPLQEQQKIASILSGVDAYIQKNQQYKERLEKLKKGLMQKLLTGQIRVKV